MQSQIALEVPTFQPKVKIDFITGHWRIRTATSVLDVLNSLQLRTQCFERPFALDFFELQADHLLVEDLENRSSLAGIYRLTPQSEGIIFDTEVDFNLRIKTKVDTKNSLKKLEVAWACTAHDYRDSQVLHMLWRGMAAYIQKAEIGLLFGNTSLHKNQFAQNKDIIEFIQSSGQELDLLTQKAKPKVEVKNDHRSKTSCHLRRRIPPLLRLYLMAGALVLLQPIFDPETNCYDYLTVLDVDNTTDPIKNHFGL